MNLKNYFFFFIIIHCSYSMAQTDLTPYVNPFIGTKGDGNTFPGATLPFGMVKVGPDCGNKRANAGFEHDSTIHGFSHTHVSGTGGGAKYGNILVMPFQGSIRDSIYGQPADYKASPGYFAVKLDNYEVLAEMTTSHKVGFHRYNFLRTTGQKGLFIDAGSFLGEGHCCGEAQELIGSEIRILDNNRVEGYTRIRGGWNKGGSYTVYFAASLDTKAKQYGLWKGDDYIESEKMVSDSGEKTGVWFYFPDGLDTLEFKVAISYISTGKAWSNLYEVDDWSFEEAKSRAKKKWNDVLSTIQVKTKDEDLKTIFYSGLYHVMLMPTDRTGENPLWSSEKPYYDDFYAIWDTYRATNPLLTLIQPKRESEIIESLIDIYRFEGYMPDSRSGNHSGRTQGGSNCDMVVADAILKGLEGFDYQMAYEAMVYNAEIPPGGDQQKNGRGGLSKYLELGYVPTAYEPLAKNPELHIPKLYPRAGTRTVEYAANDGAIALVAKKMGKTEDYIKYKKRASNWRNLWNSQIEAEGVKGFIWPRKEDGSWVQDYSVGRYGSWGNFLYEANTWEYSFYVPQDMAALIDSCGGKMAFINRLDTFFENNHFQVSNEPSFLTPTLYNYVRRQDKTNARIREIIHSNYSSALDGIPGNDDAGSMSAWVVFNLIGFFPNAGQDVYLITSPHFERVNMQIGANELSILTHNLSTDNSYIQKVVLNGQTLNRSWFRHHEIVEGGTLEFFMGSVPNNTWENVLPPSLSVEVMHKN